MKSANADEIARLKQLLAAYNYPTCTEEQLSKPGWYFFKPQFPRAGGHPKFLLVTLEAMQGGDLRCRTYAGSYTGPYHVPA